MDAQQDKLDEIIATWERGQREGWSIEARLELLGYALNEIKRLRDHLHEQIRTQGKIG